MNHNTFGLVIELDAPYLAQPYYVPELRPNIQDSIPDDPNIAEVAVSGRKWPWPLILGGAALLIILANR